MLNNGVSFGLWPGLPWIIVAAALFVEGYLLVREKSMIGKLGLILILVGGGMNFVQRLTNGGFVIDNLNILGLVYNNVADYLIAGGLLIYGYSSFVRRRRNSSN